MLALALSVAAFAPVAVSADSADDLVYADIHFEMPQTDLLPGIAAVRASCDINASGEPLVVLANQSMRSTLAASAGPCAIVVVLLGVDVTLPLFNTTPLGRSAFFLPGISTVTLGVVDLSIDLVTSLNSTSQPADEIAEVTPAEIAWTSWGAKRILVVGEDAVGSVATTELNTTFTYTMSLALTVYALSIELYDLDLAQIGSVPGAPSLVTDLSVDLKPHTLTLEAPERVTSHGATLAWTGTVDSDIDHLELWLTDGMSNVSYRLPPTATEVQVTLRPSTHYDARIVSADRGGLLAVSTAVGFDTPPEPISANLPAAENAGGDAFTWTIVTLGVVAGVVGFGLGFLRGRKVD